MILVTLFSREQCHLCDEVEQELGALQSEVPHKLVVVNIDQDPDLDAAYGASIPVVEVGPYKLETPITRQQLLVTLKAGHDRLKSLEKIERARIRRQAATGSVITKTDRLTMWMAKHYLAFFNLLVFFYVGLPFLAPVLMQTGMTLPANVIYKVYGVACHQYAFRSFYLFGDQAYYPRAAANMEGVLTYGEVSGLSENENNAARLMARNYRGDIDDGPEALAGYTSGYKIAYCQRDISIYAAILLFGLVFALTKRRIPPLPLWGWLLIGILPIGLDGFSQLVTQPPISDIFLFQIPPFTWLPYRESTPFLRSLTGGLFGLATAWFTYPLLEETFADTRRLLAVKFARLEELARQVTGEQAE